MIPLLIQLTFYCLIIGLAVALYYTLKECDRVKAEQAALKKVADAARQHCNKPTTETLKTLKQTVAERL